MRAVLRTQMLAALAVAGSLILAAGWASIAADDAPKSAPETSPIASTTKTNKGQKKAVFAKKAGDREAREVAKAYRELQKAVRNRDGNPGSKTTYKLPERLNKTIQKPTIDAKALDGLVDKTLSEAKVAPARLTTDEEFVRRVYLDVTGELPDPARIIAFCRLRDNSKRAKLIDELLETNSYARNWARYWRDVIQFHSSNENPNQVRYDQFETWMTKELAKNTPWDEIATRMIVDTGRNDEVGSVNFSIAQAQAQPVEMAGEVSRVFLGIQIQCAQCHDHPNDSWKRTQFHEFAAFFSGSKVRRELDVPKKQEASLKKELAKTKGQAKAAIAMMLRPKFVLEDAGGKARYGMPDLKDPKKTVPVAPKFFLASSEETIPVDLPVRQRRILAASYVASQDNPWFARAFINRIWYVLMGDAFYMPVDDLGPGRTPHAPEVINALADEWTKGGYDVRWLFKTILNTHAYQREIRSVNVASGRTPFAANCPSRLRSDQIFDALSHALDFPLEAINFQGKLAKAVAGTTGGGMKLGRGFTTRDVLHKLFGVDPSTPTDDVMGTIPQALFLMNGQQVNKAVEARPNTMLGKLLLSTQDNRSVLNALYLKVLARTPTTSEVETCGQYLMMVGDRKAGFEDILWALINSTEFVSRR